MQTWCNHFIKNFNFLNYVFFFKKGQDKSRKSWYQTIINAIFRFKNITIVVALNSVLVINAILRFFLYSSSVDAEYKVFTKFISILLYKSVYKGNVINRILSYRLKWIY